MFRQGTTRPYSVVRDKGFGTYELLDSFNSKQAALAWVAQAATYQALRGSIHLVQYLGRNLWQVSGIVIGQGIAYTGQLDLFPCSL